MTRANALRKFFKKYYNVDLVGMSETAVVRDMFSKVCNIDSVGNSVVSILMNVMNNNNSISPIDPVPGGDSSSKVGEAIVGDAVVGE